MISPYDIECKLYIILTLIYVASFCRNIMKVVMVLVPLRSEANQYTQYMIMRKTQNSHVCGFSPSEDI